MSSEREREREREREGAASANADAVRSHQQTAIMASMQSEMMRQVQELQRNFHTVLHELNDTKQRLDRYQAAALRLVDIAANQQGLQRTATSLPLVAVPAALP